MHIIAFSPRKAAGCSVWHDWTSLAARSAPHPS